MDVTAPLGRPHVVELPQGPVRTYSSGDGPTLLFVHGLFSNAAAWRKVVPMLAARYRCITADWPFGSHHLPMRDDADLTPRGIAETVADVIAALDLRDVVLIGNDGGTMLSQLVAAHRPERLAGLVLTSGDAFENFPPTMFKYLCWLARVPGGIAAAGHGLRIRPLRRTPNAYGWLAHDKLDHEVLDHYLTPLLDPQLRRDGIKFLRSVSNSYTLEAAEKFPEFIPPVLIAWSQDDKFFPIEHAARFATAFPDARQHVVPGARTYIADDQPERLAALISEFVDGDVGRMRALGGSGGQA